VVKIKFRFVSYMSLFFIFAYFAPAVNSYAGGDMIEVPAGEFKSGADLKAVNVDKFSIDKFPVTNADFKSFKKNFEVPPGKEKHPVVEISYFEAEEYCKAQGKRLPSGLEYEKAARGTDGRVYPWGGTFRKEDVNSLESERSDTVAVGSHAGNKSPYGVMDMVGNVWEWVETWEGKSKQYRFVMGGSYFDDKEQCKVFSSLRSIPDDTHPYIGFRCAK